MHMPMHMAAHMSIHLSMPHVCASWTCHVSEGPGPMAQVYPHVCTRCLCMNVNGAYTGMFNCMQATSWRLRWVASGMPRRCSCHARTRAHPHARTQSTGDARSRRRDCDRSRVEMCMCVKDMCVQVQRHVCRHTCRQACRYVCRHTCSQAHAQAYV